MNQNRLALVIGGSRGIGKAIVLRLAQTGFDLCVTYQSNHQAAQEVKAAVEALGRRCTLLAFDLADRESVRAALAPLLEEWDAVLHTNLDGFFNVTKPVIFEMIRMKRGRIVVISSISGQIGQAGQVNYSASKAGLIGAVKALAREVGRKNILVNVVAPGVIETEMTHALPKEQILPLIPLHRFGSSEEVAAVVNFLAAEPCMYIHGHVIGVNGGMAI
jgi:3-oxoacyl-[acyl-carrier protein] reductase